MCSFTGQYFASTMVIVGMSVVATVIVLQFHHHKVNSGPMPRWVSYRPGSRPATLEGAQLP